MNEQVSLLNVVPDLSAPNVEATRLTQRFASKTAVDHISLAILPGRRLVLLGKHAGKAMTLSVSDAGALTRRLIA